MSRTGELLFDTPEAATKVLCDRPELLFTWARIKPEGGPGAHLHREHADGFMVLEGGLTFRLGTDELERGDGSALVVPPGVVHTFRHEAGSQVQFLNFHAPSMGFLEYLSGPRSAEEVDTWFDPGEPHRAPEEAALLDFAREGETVTDLEERTVRILADFPEIAMTWSRYEAGQEGPVPHVHREHLDAFFVLEGELQFRVGPELEPVNAAAGTFVAAPPEVLHTFRNDSSARATFLNFHAPSGGFPAFLRDNGVSWDSFDSEPGSGRPADEAVVQSIHPA